MVTTVQGDDDETPNDSTVKGTWPDWQLFFALNLQFL